MEITEIRVFAKSDPNNKLRAYVTLTFDNAFVVRNVKVIEGNKGLFIAMPSRKAKKPCPKCGYKNEVRSKFCNDCGAKLPIRESFQPDSKEWQSEHRDIAHPITVEFHEYLEKKVLEAYEREKSGSSFDTGSSNSPQSNTLEYSDEVD